MGLLWWKILKLASIGQGCDLFMVIYDGTNEMQNNMNVS